MKVPTPERPRQNAERREAWIERETRRRLAEEDPDAPRNLLPIEQFPATSVFAGMLKERAQKRSPGEPCQALEALIAGSCNGWVKRPTAEEMEQAVKSRQSTRRARCLARVVLSEASTMCIAEADAAGAFSLQDLAWWIKEIGLPCYSRIKWLNAMGRAWQPVAKVPAAFERRCIPPDCVVRRLHMPNMRPPHALSGGRLAALGATRGFHHGLLAAAGTTERETKPQPESPMTRLTLPEPAGDLWLQTRDILTRLGPAGNPWAVHLGGGTVLGARLHHRESTDIDIVVHEVPALGALARPGPENLTTRLGGTTIKETQGQIRIRMKTGVIDVNTAPVIPEDDRPRFV